MSDLTYYDRPLLKEPVWEWVIPFYYYVGGLTGASLVLGAAAQLAGSEETFSLVTRSHWTGFFGAGLSGGLLIWDLADPNAF
jgi:formate-dependent nitrite reductase membrane component NrfD